MIKYLPKSHTYSVEHRSTQQEIYTFLSGEQIGTSCVTNDLVLALTNTFQYNLIKRYDT